MLTTYISTQIEKPTLDKVPAKKNVALPHAVLREFL